ncbi:hypothetical protein DYB32_004438 [Aphanomyces invadans]|uniref:Uncharacterized protein n=1 Tax=Aphanomyces invadans TaxID=157072 RepID=A0A3R6Z4V9_9STRA|nr:hypothetical protein DYB32_004438 [Aphanomyces invadans]
MKICSFLIPATTQRETDMATGDGGDAKGPSRVMSYHDRLVHFYTEHNPSMIPSIESLLRRYKGEEEALIQSVHIKYDVRDLVSDEAVDDIFENESLAGVFVGLQDFWVERLALTFQLHFTDPTRLEATFQGAFCGEFHGIKVKGDKGTRIPNAKWSQVASDFEFRGRWALLCEKEPTGWTLDQAKSTPVDFTAMNMQYRGGLGIPDALVQLILQDLVTNYITDIVAKSLPPELNKLMLRPTSGIEVRSPS